MPNKRLEQVAELLFFGSRLRWQPAPSATVTGNTTTQDVQQYF